MNEKKKNVCLFLNIIHKIVFKATQIKAHQHHHERYVCLNYFCLNFFSSFLKWSSIITITTTHHNRRVYTLKKKYIHLWQNMSKHNNRSALTCHTHETEITRISWWKLNQLARLDELKWDWMKKFVRKKI